MKILFALLAVAGLAGCDSGAKMNFCDGGPNPCGTTRLTTVAEARQEVAVVAVREESTRAQVLATAKHNNEVALEVSKLELERAKNVAAINAILLASIPKQFRNNSEALKFLWSKVGGIPNDEAINKGWVITSTGGTFSCGQNTICGTAAINTSNQ